MKARRLSQPKGRWNAKRTEQQRYQIEEVSRLCARLYRRQGQASYVSCANSLRGKAGI
jgi:hypothetical protein